MKVVLAEAAAADVAMVVVTNTESFGTGIHPTTSIRQCCSRRC